MAMTALHARLGLTRNPFPPTPDASSYFFTPELQEQFSEVLHCIQARKGFVLLTGEVGLGKSTFVRRLLDALPQEETRSALVFNTFLQREALLSAILRDFGLEPSDDMDEALARLNRFLMEEYQAGRTCLLVVDDAQNLQPASLELVRLLCNLETGQEKLLQILLAGQPELEALLEGREMRQLKSRVVKHARLSGLRRGELPRYFEMRVGAAGAQGRIELKPAAARLLYRATGGNLRRIHLVLDRCLYGLAAQGGGAIRPALVRAAVQDVAVGPLPSRLPSRLRMALALGGAGLAALGVGAASYVWQPAMPSASPPPAAPQVAAVPAAVAPPEAPVPELPAVPAAAAPVVAAAPEAVSEPACLSRLADEAGGLPIIGRRLPEAAQARLRSERGLCLFQRGQEHWALWGDTLNRSAFSAIQVSPANTALQNALVRQGALEPSQVDGFYGPRTAAALGSFQTALGLPATALPDELSHMLLEKMDAPSRAAGTRHD